nr:MAG TPA: hypothetical protein [Caudoviricetes sp.]
MLNCPANVWVFSIRSARFRLFSSRRRAESASCCVSLITVAC